MMDKQILIITASFLGLSMGLFFLMTTVLKKIMADKSKILLYGFLFAAGFSLVALLSYRHIISDPGILLPVFQFCFFGLGVLHVWALYSYFDWDSNDSPVQELLFSIFVLLLALIPFLLIYTLLNDVNGYQYLMLGASLFFMVPVLFWITFEAAISIPHPEFKKWFYPVHTRVNDPEWAELENPFVISFIICKTTADEKPTIFRAKAPAKMSVERLFYFFIDDYNGKHAESPIEFSDNSGQPYGWLFYFKPKWYLFFRKRYIDVSLKVNEHKIRENSVIICERTEAAASAIPVLHEYSVF